MSNRGPYALEIDGGIVLEGRVAVRIEIVGPHLRAPLGSRQCVGPHPREHVDQHIALAHQVYQAQVFVLQSRVPEHGPKVELVLTLALAHQHVVLVGPRDQFHRQRAVLVLDAARLVHHRAQVSAVFLRVPFSEWGYL